jgi:hypothetical protein
MKIKKERNDPLIDKKQQGNGTASENVSAR